MSERIHLPQEAAKNYRTTGAGSADKSSSPQRLKPDSLHSSMYGLKAVQFKQSAVFRSLFSP
jgi:hypothetical protein